MSIKPKAQITSCLKCPSQNPNRHPLQQLVPLARSQASILKHLLRLTDLDMQAPWIEELFVRLLQVLLRAHFGGNCRANASDHVDIHTDYLRDYRGGHAG